MQQCKNHHNQTFKKNVQMKIYHNILAILLEATDYLKAGFKGIDTICFGLALKYILIHLLKYFREKTLYT